MEIDFFLNDFVEIVPRKSTSGGNDEFFIEEEQDLDYGRRGVSSQFSAVSQKETPKKNVVTKNTGRSSSNRNNNNVKVQQQESDTLKKFGNAKAISSEQFFQDSVRDPSVSR